MPYESGGRADKSGNRYEIKVAIYYLLKVLEEKIDYLIIEPLGEEEQGVDILICDSDGKKEGMQCKGRNGSKSFWDFGTANSKNILSKWKLQLERDSSFCVALATPLSFPMLEDLTSRAKNTSDNINNFYKDQVLSSSKDLVKFYKNFCSVFTLDPDESNDQKRCVNYLNRINIRQFPDSQLQDILKDKINYLFIDDKNIIYDKLIAWVVDGDLHGKRITSSFFKDYLSANDLKLKNLANDNRIIPRFDILNQEYRESFKSLKGGFFNRDEFSKCRESLDLEKSLIIHGKAGIGKSGVTEDIINYCNENKINFIAIKLDKRIPSLNAFKWGNELGLPESIVHCIHSISKENKAIIILDQLDALRWTQSHSKDSLLVCEEIIRQISNLNMERTNNISVVFVCRTYDLENDNNIKGLLEEKYYFEGNMTWEKIHIGEVNDNQVKDIVGADYESYTNKLKSLLKIPSNLYIWQHLDIGKVTQEFTTTKHMISSWWNQLIKKYVESGFQDWDIIETKI
jgi:hypothetical protein